MTRQEIRERAERLDQEYDITPMHDTVNMIERRLIDFRRATLEEAARGVESAQPRVVADLIERYGLELGWSSMRAECLRVIRELIAALDKPGGEGGA